MSYAKALYVNGKIVTGPTHGHAFAELTEEEKENIDKIVSGFFDSKTGQFIDPDNDIEFYVKKIILIRHGNVDADNQNPTLSREGINEVKKTTYFLQKNIDLTNAQAFVSPYLRCCQTAQIIADHVRIQFKISQEIREESNESSSDFFLRLKRNLEKLPAKSLIISHSDVIEAIIRLSTGVTNSIEIPTASVTLINKKQPVCLGFKY